MGDPGIPRRFPLFPSGRRTEPSRWFWFRCRYRLSNWFKPSKQTRLCFLLRAFLTRTRTELLQVDGVGPATFLNWSIPSWTGSPGTRTTLELSLGPVAVSAAARRFRPLTEQEALLIRFWFWFWLVQPEGLEENLSRTGPVCSGNLSVSVPVFPAIRLLVLILIDPVLVVSQNLLSSCSSQNFWSG